jgi:hypothetical protein
MTPRRSGLADTWLSAGLVLVASASAITTTGSQTAEGGLTVSDFQDLGPLDHTDHDSGTGTQERVRVHSTKQGQH